MEYATSERHKALRERMQDRSAQRFEPLAEAFGLAPGINWELLHAMGEAGLFGFGVPEAYGGQGDQSDYATTVCVVREQLARTCPAAELLFATMGLGSYALVLAGTEEQKRRHLPGVVAGNKLFAFALTEPNAGTDAGALETSAVPDGDAYVLTGVKNFVSNAPHADVYVVYAKTDPELGSKGVSAFIVERGTPGLHPGPSMELLASNPIGELTLKDCRVHRSQLLGERGKGFRLALQALDVFRPSVGAQAVGFAQAAYELALQRARERQTFGKRLAEHQAIQFKLTDMYTQISAARGLVYYAAARRDAGEQNTREASMAKLYASEMAQKVVYEAQQIWGGYGLIKGSPLEALGRLVRATTIYEGTSEVQRLIIARQLLAE